MESLTPMMKQYLDIKKRYQEEILFFRMGDFYEMFYEDAERASQILDIALTKRNDIPMCGIPHHAKNNYLYKIIKSGHKVAICDQLEDPSVAKGIVKRGVTEVITPGTLVDDNLLNQLDVNQHNFIMALYYSDKKSNSNHNKPVLSLAYVDLSTSDFYLYQEEEENLFQSIVDRLYQINPSELILADCVKDDPKMIKLLEKYQKGLTKNYLPNYRFEPKEGETTLMDLLKVKTLKGFEINDMKSAIGTAGALIYYLKETQLREISHLNKIQPVKKNKSLLLNETTIKNLELVTNLQDGTRKFTLYQQINNTKTAMGARLLHLWLLNPLVDKQSIEERLSIVTYLFHNKNLLDEIRSILNQFNDIERLIGKIALNKINPRDLIALKNSLLLTDTIKLLLKDHKQFDHYLKQLPELQKIVQLIELSILEEPSLDFTNGSVIQHGYNSELDELREISQKGKDYLIEIQEEEKTKNKIPNLKLKFNKVLGYFIEVSKGNDKNVPDYYIKKQSLVNVTRYTIPELAEYETKILGAQDKIVTLERQLFEEIRLFLCDYLTHFKQVSEIISEIDILAGFSHTALYKNYVLPEIYDGDEIIIQDGRHPVVEEHLIDTEYIPNDLNLNNSDSRLLIITGPNMAGKSTYLRQVALIVIMAQIGSYVPAQYAKISLVDQIFTRIGASDNLARGESTFLIEMIETAIILNNATNKSLIIMDEIGRGTSTYDGLSIAWSIIEYLTQIKKVGKILFATHYHELTVLSKEKGIQCYQVMVKEWGDEIIFLHKVKEGNASKSYGIQVARLAGLPEKVIKRAREVLYELENKNYKVEDDLLNFEQVKDEYQTDSVQFSLFSDNFETLAKEVLQIDINSPQPLLIKKIEKLQHKIRKGEL